MITAAPDVLVTPTTSPDSAAQAWPVRPADYLDYRAYLKDLYLARKRKDRRFSYRFIALKAGFRSVGFFSQIVHGKTNISLTTVLRLGEVFKMDAEELEHFESLVNWNQAKNPPDREHFARKLGNLRRRDARLAEERLRPSQTHSTLSVRLSDAAFLELRSEIAAFRRRIQELAVEPGGEGREYQVKLRVQAIPTRE
jgi:hypothetical protein